LDDIGEQSQFCHPDAEFTLSAFCYRCERTLAQPAVLSAIAELPGACGRAAMPSFSLPCDTCSGLSHITLTVEYAGVRGRRARRLFEYYSSAQLLHHLRLCASARVQLTHLRQVRAHCPELMWNAHFRHRLARERLYATQLEQRRSAAATPSNACLLRRPPSPVLRGRHSLTSAQRDVTHGRQHAPCHGCARLSCSESDSSDSAADSADELAELHCAHILQSHQPQNSWEEQEREQEHEYEQEYEQEYEHEQQQEPEKHGDDHLLLFPIDMDCSD
jgi:hypothetical protein